MVYNSLHLVKKNLIDIENIDFILRMGIVQKVVYSFNSDLENLDQEKKID